MISFLQILHVFCPFGNLGPQIGPQKWAFFDRKWGKIPENPVFGGVPPGGGSVFRHRGPPIYRRKRGRKGGSKRTPQNAQKPDFRARKCGFWALFGPFLGPPKRDQKRTRF